MYIHLTVIITIVLSVCILLISVISRLLKRELCGIIRDHISSGEAQYAVQIRGRSWYSHSLQEHLKHLQKFYELVYKHGLVLSEPKMEIGKTEIEFLGFKIQKGQIILQNHVLSCFENFPNEILDKTQLQRFLESLNYIRPFYKGQAEDIKVLQQRLKKDTPRWSAEMSDAVRKIKLKVTELPPLSLPTGNGQLIIETDASSSTWGGVLLEAINGRENICGYGSSAFKVAKLKYPSSHKEILAIKKTVMHFKLFLKPINFIVRTDLKIMPGIFKNERLMAEKLQQNLEVVFLVKLF